MWFTADPGSGAEALPHNTFERALAEAAFLTGVERNADVVAMTCYAPLFEMRTGFIGRSVGVLVVGR